MKLFHTDQKDYEKGIDELHVKVPKFADILSSKLNEMLASGEIEVKYDEGVWKFDNTVDLEFLFSDITC